MSAKERLCSIIEGLEAITERLGSLRHYWTAPFFFDIIIKYQNQIIQGSDINGKSNI